MEFVCKESHWKSVSSVAGLKRSLDQRCLTQQLLLYCWSEVRGFKSIEKPWLVVLHLKFQHAPLCLRYQTFCVLAFSWKNLQAEETYNELLTTSFTSLTLISLLLTYTPVKKMQARQQPSCSASSPERIQPTWAASTVGSTFSNELIGFAIFRSIYILFYPASLYSGVSLRADIDDCAIEQHLELPRVRAIRKVGFPVYSFSALYAKSFVPVYCSCSKRHIIMMDLCCVVSVWLVCVVCCFVF